MKKTLASDPKSSFPYSIKDITMSALSLLLVSCLISTFFTDNAKVPAALAYILIASANTGLNTISLVQKNTNTKAQNLTTAVETLGHLCILTSLIIYLAGQSKAELSADAGFATCALVAIGKKTLPQLRKDQIKQVLPTIINLPELESTSKELTRTKRINLAFETCIVLANLVSLAGIAMNFGKEEKGETVANSGYLVADGLLPILYFLYLSKKISEVLTSDKKESHHLIEYTSKTQLISTTHKSTEV